MVTGGCTDTDRWKVLLDEPSPSGKLMFQCSLCLRKSVTPDKTCPVMRDDPYPREGGGILTGIVNASRDAASGMTAAHRLVAEHKVRSGTSGFLPDGTYQIRYKIPGMIGFVELRVSDDVQDAWAKMLGES